MKHLYLFIRARLGLGIPIAALLFASFLGLLLFTVFLGESRNSERKTDGQVRMEITVFMVVLLYALGGKHKLCPRERIKSSNTRPSSNRSFHAMLGRLHAAARRFDPHCAADKVLLFPAGMRP